MFLLINHYHSDFRPNGIVAPYSNEDRQTAVNHHAEYIGASSGTARYYGVPGTDINFGYGGYGGYSGYRGYGNHGSYEHGYGGYGRDGHRGYGSYGGFH